GPVDSAFRRDGDPCLAPDRQQVPADHRAAQPEHGDPGRRLAVRSARQGPRPCRLVDTDQPHLPCCSPCPDDGAPDPGAKDHILAGSVTFTAIVLAGSRPGRDYFAEQFGNDMKALIAVAGEPMVRRPVRALLASESVGSLVLLSQAPERIAAVVPADPRVTFRKSGGTIAETMLALCDDPTTRWPMIVPTADHALLDPATVDEFAGTAHRAGIRLGVGGRAV